MEEPYIGASKLEEPCSSCKRYEVVITGIIAGFIFPLSDVFALDCKNCGHAGSGHHDSRGWNIKWDEIATSTG